MLEFLRDQFLSLTCDTLKLRAVQFTCLAKKNCTHLDNNSTELHCAHCLAFKQIEMHYTNCTNLYHLGIAVLTHTWRALHCIPVLLIVADVSKIQSRVVSKQRIAKKLSGYMYNCTCDGVSRWTKTVLQNRIAKCSRYVLREVG